MGTWQYISSYGTSTITFNGDNTMVVDGEIANYAVNGNYIAVSNALGTVYYGYRFKDQNLILTFSDGTSVEMQKTDSANETVQPGGNLTSSQEINLNQNNTGTTSETGIKKLLGKWIYNGNQGNITLSINSDNSLVYNGEKLSYNLSGKSFMVNTEYGVTSYPFQLNGEKLTITFPEGYNLTFSRSEIQNTNSGNTHNISNGNSGQLYGKLCYFSSSSDGYSGYSRTEYIYFDGNGRFNFYEEASFSSDAGLAYGGDTQPEFSGNYSINGDIVTMFLDNGESYTFRVNMRQNSGQITELLYGQKLYATGLCQ